MSLMHGGDSNDAISAVVLVLCIPLHAKACCRPSISTVVSCLRRQQTSIILMAVNHILVRQQCFAYDGIQSTRTTPQVASFESPPCYHQENMSVQ